MGYDELKSTIKKRDGRCTEPGCTSKVPLSMMLVVRVDMYLGDTEDNLRTVCKKHRPHWES